MSDPSTSSKASNDRALRFYRDVLGLDRLHYGLWEEGDELTMQALQAAQKRYEDFLIANIPEGTKSILDVGCGTGALCRTLKDLRYEVEGLSPDRNQKKNFAETVEAPFHFTKFEDASFEHVFDLLIMSESAQYVPLDRLFAQAASALAPGGSLMICDYFVVDQDAGELSKSGHDHEAFLAAAQASNFAIERRQNVTQDTRKTLEIADLWAHKFLLGAEILTEKFRERNPRTSRFAKWLFRKKIDKMNTQRILLDAEKFCAAKRYEFFLFRKS